MKYLRYYQSIKFLKIRQIFFQLRLKIFGRFITFNPKRFESKKIPIKHLEFKVDFLKKKQIIKDGRFNFLNKPYNFNEKIDWNFNQFGNLWNYNLNYMDYLLQEDIDSIIRLQFLEDFINNSNNKFLSYDPYPISLRGINWIKFLSIHKIQNQTINSSLYHQYIILRKRPEFHLQANHLLENGLSMIFCAFFFSDIKMWKFAKALVEKELKEQILDDGGHFELSPMYHQIIFERVLDVINMLKSNTIFDNQDELIELMEEKATKMMFWLRQMTYSNGEIPLYNDSAMNIAPTTDELIEYYNRLDLKINEREGPLGVSGYRRINKKIYECIIDVGRIGPDYQPGHAHSDVFNFTIMHNGRQLICDSGTSTYENIELRRYQRSILAHNTVEVFNTDPNEMYDSFKVGKRIKDVVIQKDEPSEISAFHNGYLKFGIKHSRNFIFDEKEISITDSLEGVNHCKGVFRLHLLPDVNVIESASDYIKTDELIIRFENAEFICLENYIFANEFNIESNGKVVVVEFKNKLNSKIIFRD